MNKSAALLLLCLLPLLSCQGQIDQKTIDDLKAGVSQITSELGPVAGNLTDKASSGASAVFKYEYKVFTIDSAQSDQEFESILNQLGSERWDCYSQLATQNGIRITCRKIPYAIIRSLMGAM